MRHRIGIFTATSIVVANVIGVGIFASLGFQLAGIHSLFNILLLWILGGAIALTGAFSYGELATALPTRSGGEYHYLGRIYHPLLGFISGWISILAGFGASIAAIAVAMSTYLIRFVDDLHYFHVQHENFWIKTLAVFFAMIISLVNSFHYRGVALLQNISTILKIGLILCFIGAIFFLGTWQNVSFLPTAQSMHELWTGSFAISLVFVLFTYSGWECVVYIAGEVKKPRRNIPRILILGSLIVTVLYVLITVSFLVSTPADVLRGKLQVAFLVAQRLFGPLGFHTVLVALALTLIATMNSDIWAGSRVLQMMGQDYRLFSWFSKTRNQVPYLSVLFQFIVVTFFIVTSTFQSIVIYVGILYALSKMMTVIGVFILRHREKRKGRRTPGYRMPLYPFPALFFVAFMSWVVVYTAITAPREGLEGLLSIVLASLLYFVARRHNLRKLPSR